MRKIPIALTGVAAAAVGLLALTTGVSDAHHPEVEVACVSAPANIRVTATAWDAPTLDERVNDNIEITFDGVAVGVGGFNAANNYTFTLDVVAPASTGTHVVRATSLHPWGILENDPDPVGVGEFREATVVLPCGAIPATTTTVAPTTTVPATTTTVPTDVRGVTVTRPEVAAPVDVSPRFAG
jgi:hypothetical protein